MLICAAEYQTKVVKTLTILEQEQQRQRQQQQKEMDEYRLAEQQKHQRKGTSIVQ